MDAGAPPLQMAVMRFVPGGPDIPEELLVARDKGDVIFFCGAGVSQHNAHLPNFENLSRKVIGALGSAQDSPARKLLETAAGIGAIAGVGGLVATDRIFGLLEREFEVQDVREAVAKAIRPPDGYGLDAHRVLLDLATSRTGVTRLVTTNFDPLFEESAPDLPSWGPPRLPDPRSDHEFRGIVHLHGRVSSDYVKPSDDEFIVSSADFGRAYLSDGWATRFIQALLTRYQIVFVGYSADDPPMQYLLEALNLHAGTRARLFALQAGDAGEAAALWEQRGVRAIPFDDTHGFGLLWDSLSAWAARARDVDGWYADVIKRARGGPGAADPHFRGMLATILSTREGAHQIAGADDTIDARWLLAFDPRQRYAPRGNIEPYDDASEKFDPFDVLGLDCDEPPDPEEDDENRFQRRQVPENAFDPLLSNVLDEDDRRELSTGEVRGARSSLIAAMPPRLVSIGLWLDRVAHEPVALWWAAQQQRLHPQIKRFIEYSIRGAPDRFPDAVRKGWQWLFAAWSDDRRDPDDARYDLEARAARDGWSLSVVRDLAAIYRPQLKVQSPFGERDPLNWETALPERLISLDVEYPRPHEPLLIPDEHVAYAVSQFRNNLELAIALEREVTGTEQIYLMTSRADDGQDADEDVYGLTGLVVTFQNLMIRLASFDVAAARAEVRRWPTEDEHVFARLRIWAAGRRDFLEAGEAPAIFLGLADEVFWGSSHQRDLLYAIRDKWSELTEPDRRALEHRLRTGSYPFAEGVRGGPERAAAYYRLGRLSWLAGQGLAFDFDLDAEIAKLREVAPDWTPDAGAQVAASDVPQVFTVETDEAADALLEVPIPEILPAAQEAGEMRIQDRVQREPFQGLAKRLPVRAFLALAHAARRGEAPRHPWSAFLSSEARRNDGPRMIAAITARLCRLPIECFRDIAYPVSEWMRDIADRLYDDAKDSLPSLWERMVKALQLGSTSRPHQRGRSWADDALNAPVGKLVDLLTKDPVRDGLEVGSGLPSEWCARVEQLLALPGDLRRQALVMISHRTNWLFAVDRNWVAANLLPLAMDEGPDGDAFWDGYLWAAQMPSRELFLELKPALTARVVRPRRARNHGNILAGFLLAGWGGAAEAEEPERLISDVEFREVLIHSDDEFRTQVLWNLERWSSGGKGQWSQRLLIFLGDIWPKQRALRTSTISSALANLALSSGDLVPEVVASILPRLVTVRGGRLHSLGLDTANPDHAARRFPKAMLDLLEVILPEDPRSWPYRTDAVLDILEQSPDVAADARLADLRRRR